MASHPDLQAEQAHLDRAYERLESLRAAARSLLESALRQRGGTPQAVAERDVLVRTALHRLEQLELGGESLCFGRIDLADGQSFHIGRLAVSGHDQEPLVVDWRAPVAEPFYRATGRHPMGLVRRRHFATEGRRLVGIEDEVFAGEHGDGSGPDGASAPELVGPGALLAALERSRSGRMRDIVATVQREQDEVIRSELAGVLVVQGGPGTGKTAVALHRAAYLLYTHRFPLERQGVLVVGPNALYLRYVRHVLPSLGEAGVVLTTLEGLVPEARARAAEGRLAARVKGDARMARVLARAVRDRQRPLRRPLEVRAEGVVLQLSPEASRQAVAAARRRSGPHNSGRRHVEAWVARHFEEQFRRSVERRRRVGVRAGPPAKAEPAAESDLGVDPLSGWDELWPALRRHPDVGAALDRIWPLLSPEELLHDLFGAPPLLRLAARGLLSDEEMAALQRGRSSSLHDIPWTDADAPLVDEARLLLGPRRQTSADGDGDVRTYGHIVLDEAQDLSAMQLRMLARRSLSGSMTVVGDIAQATGPRAPESWGEVLDQLPRHPARRVAELSVNYRTPGEVMQVASRVLAQVAPDLRPPLSVRSTGSSPAVRTATPPGLARAVAEVTLGEVAEVRPGTVAVITVPSLTAAVADALRVAGVDFAGPDGRGLEAPVTLLPVGLAKGLEFDSVVVAEPARLVAEEAQGLRALYVALTRPTRRLTIVHADELPDVLRASDSTLLA